MSDQQLMTESARARKMVKDHLASLAASAGEAGDIVQSVRAMMDGYGSIESDRQISSRILPVRTDEFVGEWVIPPDAHPTRRIVYLHGGGWLAGSPSSHRHLTDRIAQANKCSLLVVDYGLSPEHPFPEAITASRAGLQWANDFGPEGRASATNLSVGGDSCGGNIAIALVLDSIEHGGLLPDSLFLLSPVTDVRPPDVPPKGNDCAVVSGDGLIAMAEHYLSNGATIGDPLVSPLAASRSVLAQFPPTLIQVSSDEYVRDQGVRLATALWEESVEVHLSVWPKLPHVFQLFTNELVHTSRAIREIAEFIQDY